METSVVTIDEFINNGSTGRHETFTPRYGWLKKGYTAAINDPAIFKAPDSIERLGVGKNMVSSMRFWCQAFKLLESDRNALMSPTFLGDRLLSNNGWDPYLEDIASLWILHWQLFIPRLDAVNWSFTFNKCNLPSFALWQLGELLVQTAGKYPRFAPMSENTFERDASCLIRMYAEDSWTRESEIDCPFTQLGLIHKAEETNEYAFDNTYKASLPALIFAAACFSFINNYAASGQKTISLHRLAFDFNSPGVAFRVPESAVGSYLSAAAEKMDGFDLIDSLGSIQVYWEVEPVELYWSALEKYYEEQQ